MSPIPLVMVEDDPMVMEVHKNFIEQIGGFSFVSSARTGQQGLEMIKAHQPGLVILDIYLPDMSGVEVLKEMRRQEIPADVIMITAAQDVATIQHSFRFGVIDYIIKPFKFDRIKAALEKYKRYHSKLNSNVSFVQEELDAFITMHPGVNPSPNQQNNLVQPRTSIPKGLREITLRQILQVLSAKKQGLSAEDVAVEIGLARVTARRYLDYLERIGEVELESQYGSIGRPLNRYRKIDRL